MPKHTPLAEIHAELDAKTVPLCGWDVPLNYPGGIVAETRHTRKYCSVIDASFCGKIRIAGEQCTRELDKILLFHTSDTAPGKCSQNFLLDDNGHFSGTFDLFRMAEDDCFLVTHPANTAKLLARFQELLPETIAVQDLTDAIARIDILGPDAPEVLFEAETEAELLPEKNSCGMIEIAGIRCIISCLQKEGIPGYQLFCGADNAIGLWDELTCIEPVRPAGTGAWECLRLEMGCIPPETGYPASMTPPECGIALPDKVFAGCSALTDKKVSGSFFFVKLEGKQGARPGDQIKTTDGRETGNVVACSVSPAAGCACAICRCRIEDVPANDANVIFITASGELAGKVCNTPFIA